MSPPPKKKPAAKAATKQVAKATAKKTSSPSKPATPPDPHAELRFVIDSAWARRTQPRHLRHFRLVPQIGFDSTDHGERTLLSLVSTDRPGLLADVTRVLRDQRLRVHDARIATFGERAEDVFQITDERDAALDIPRQQALREALLARIDGE